MQTKIIAGIAALLVLGGIAYAVTQSQEETSTNPTSVNTTAESTPTQNSDSPSIIYTPDGFSPETITVAVGTTVMWTNTSGARMWVGSDDHPSHTHYDGSSTRDHCANGAPTGPDVFDQCSATDTFSFTFTKAGTWEYHNHANSSHGGTIIVTDANASASTDMGADASTGIDASIDAGL